MATMIEIGHAVELTNSILIRYNWLKCNRECVASVACVLASVCRGVQVRVLSVERP